MDNGTVIDIFSVLRQLSILALSQKENPDCLQAIGVLRRLLATRA